MALTRSDFNQRSFQNTNQYYLNSAKRDHTIQVETTFDVVDDVERPTIQVTAVSENLSNVSTTKRTSDDGLSLDSSSYKIPQDEEAKIGEYKLQDLGVRSSTRHNSAAPWEYQS
jgi:hypothetical protein